MANVGVEALLTWLNNLELTDQPLHIEDLKDGTYLLKVINTLKNEPSLSLDLSVEDRFNQIAGFLEGDCRLRAGTGATLSRHIANGNNLTVEISKVLLLLVYYDMMNNRSTLNKMELKVEVEIASLTERFVLVTDDYVYLSNGLEAYLGRKYSSSPSTQSSSSLIDDSPVFHRSQKVKFVDLHTVATPAASSRSPLQEVMNTPRFKLRKMQTQMIHEREYKDGLTRELSSLMAQISQKETEISQLKYQLDKIKENQNVQDQVVSDQINELETKNESLQRRLHELAKQSHDLKSDTIHMERKVDQLTEENGNLSVQVREMRLKLATCEAELERLLENQANVEKELQSQNCHLQAELSQATAQKDFQYEQIEILQGKISSLEEELSRIRLEEKGENMGPVMQRAELENEITDLKDQLEITTGSLREAKQVVQAKEAMLAQYQEDITLHKELLKQQMAKSEKEMQDKQVLLDQTQKEIADERHILQQEKNNLQLQVDSIGVLLKESQEDAKLKEEQMLQKNTRHDTALDQQKTFYQGQMGRLKEEIQQKQELIDLLKVRAEKVELLNQEIQTLRNEVETLTSSLKKAEEYLQTQEDLLAKQQLDSVKIQETLQNKITMFQEEVHGLWVEEIALQADVKLAKETIQAKEDMLANLQMESSQQTDILKRKMHGLEGQLKTITTTLSNAKQDLKTQQDMCNLHQQEHAHQLEELQKKMFASEEKIERLVQEIIQKEQQMTEVKKETSAHSEELQQEINSLMSQVAGVTDSLRKAEEKLQDRETLLTQQEQESAHQKDLLQKQVSACEEEFEKMKREIKTKEEQLTLLGRNGSEQSALLQEQIQGLNSQVESLSSSLKQTEEEVLGQKHQLSKQELASTQQMHALQQLNLVSEENIRLLKEEIQTKETLLNEIRTESSKQSENLANQIQHLTLEMDNTKESLKMASEEVEAKEDVLTNLRQERNQLKTTMEVCEEETALLKQEILLKEQQLTEMKKETSANSEELQQEINSLMSQVTGVTDSLRKAEEKLQDRENLLTQQEQESAHQKDLLQKQVSASEVEVEMLKQEIKSKEEQLTLLGQNGSEQTAVLQQKSQILTNQVDSLSFSMKKAEKDIQTASDAAKHYKTQMENAMNHYKAKKQLLQESQEQVAEMQRSLDEKEKLGTEFKLLKLDFETVKSNEKSLLSRVTSLEAQLAFADGQLREHNKMRRDGGRLQDFYFTETEENWKIQTRDLKEKHDSSDSQGDDTLEDSLSTTRRPSAPGESSTPMVRSSERLAGKRRSLSADSLESLYFTPMNNKQTSRTKRHMDNSLTSLAELPDSTLKNLSSSVKRRRTTQVINITMSKKTPRRGGSDNDRHGEDEDTFYSLASARSHPNLSNSHAARPVSMELSGKTAASSDQLMSLPGYRRSTTSTTSTTAPTRSTSTFCVGAENEPENGPDDWMRIAELQSRNKACLPHLKSSYPLESRPSIGPEFVITDDDLRMGDPTDTIRRATLMPSQMLDSLSSHRLSYMVGQTDTAGTRAHRHSLLPGQLPARTHSSSLQKYPLSPEAKASCFPRPLTPKYKNSHMTSSSIQIRTALSPVQRRESTVFTIENTPKKNSYLQKGLNRLRSSTRKSPSKGLKMSPAQRASGRSPGNRAAEVGVAVARRGNTRALPQGAAAAKGQRRSPRTSAKSTAKSPRTSAKSTTNSQLLTSSARKMMSRMKV